MGGICVCVYIVGECVHMCFYVCLIVVAFSFKALSSVFAVKHTRLVLEYRCL